MSAFTWFASVGFDAQLCGRLCMTLAHSLWQFGLLALLATLVCRLSKHDKPERDYAVYLTALLVGLAALPITFAMIEVPAPLIAVTNQPVAVAQSQVAPIPATQLSGHAAEFKLSIAAQREAPESRIDIPQQPSADSWLFRMTPWLAGCYVVGVVLMMLRLARGIWQSHQLATHARPITSGPLHSSMHSLARTWSLRFVPALAQAQGIVVPQVVGLLRPTILLPTSAIMGLTPEELEMILAHELTHVRRYDMWVILLQRFAETALFFNPGLWYLSRRISTYREYCCDEQTCRVASREPSAARLCYAQALLHVVELSGKVQHAQVAALAATGNRPSELRRRVARLFGEPLREPVRMSRGGLLVLIMGLAFLLVGPVSWQTAREPAKELKSELTDASQETSPDSKVKVVAIGTHDEEPQRWWDVEGQPLKEIPFDWQDANNVSSSEKIWRRVVFQIDSLPQDTKVRWEIVGGGSWGDATSTPKIGGESATYFARYFGVPGKEKDFGLRIGIAAGPWKLVESSSQGLTATARLGQGIVTSNTFPSEGGSVVVVSHNLEGVDFRVIAVDKLGKRSTTEKVRAVSASKVKLAQWHFPEVKPDDIDRFEFETREYDWVEFKDLPVEPGARSVGMQSKEPVKQYSDSEQAWLTKLRELKDHNPTAFAVGPKMIAELSPQEAWDVARTVWPEIEIDEVKTGLLKTFEFARHPRVLDVLDLGATDGSQMVREYAYSYLQNYALRDFNRPEFAYEAWRQKYRGKPTEEVLAGNCRWFVDYLRNGPPITSWEQWNEVESMLELSGSKSSYPEKADYLREAGLQELIKAWLNEPEIDEKLRGSFERFLVQLDQTLAEDRTYERADLSGRNLAGLVLQGNVDELFMFANLSKADLSGATLVGGRKSFYEANFSQANLNEAILIGRAAFQKANFEGASLENTLIKSGGAGLQIANFDDATIKGARFSGSFQLATFRRARIADTRFEGMGPALQVSNFDDARLTNTALLGTSFQGVSLNNTEFIDCDLSTIRTLDLESSKFSPTTPPRYDAETKFPKGFDPKKQGWKFIE